METVLTITLIGLGLILALAGIIACILPILPGPPMSYAALLLLAWARDWTPFSLRFLIIMAVLMVLAAALDNIVPLLGARRYGASKQGIWGSILGMLAGIFFVPPWGVFIGAFLGALAGELMAGKESGKALRVGWGIFMGTMVAIGMKLSFSVAALYFFIRGMA